MKKIYLLCLFLSIRILLFAQNEPALNVGAGLSYVITSSKYNSGPHNMSGYNFTLEKPFFLGSSKNKFLSVYPGVRYEKLREYYETSGLGKWYSYEHVLNAATVQAKVLINSKLKSEMILYTGASAGTLFWSDIKDAKYPDKEISEYRKSSFSRGVLGIVLGIRSKTTEEHRFSPAFEIIFYPKYIASRGETKNALSFSIQFGIGAKKELPE